MDNAHFTQDKIRNPSKAAFTGKREFYSCETYFAISCDWSHLKLLGEILRANSNQNRADPNNRVFTVNS